MPIHDFEGDEFNAEDDKTEEPASPDLHTPLVNQTTDILNDRNTEEIPGEEEGAPLLSIVTRSRKRKFLDYDEMASVSSSPVSEISKNFESEAGDDNCPVGKRPNLSAGIAQDFTMSNREICDVIVRDVVHDVIRSVVDDVICDVVDDVISKVLVCEYTDVAVNGVGSDGYVGTTVIQDDKDGLCDEKKEVNGLEINDQNDYLTGVSNDNKEEQLKNIDTMDNRGTAMDTDTFEHAQNHKTCEDKMANGDVQNTDLRNTDTKVETCSTGVNEHPSSVTYPVQNCHGSQRINTSTTCDEGNNMYRNGENTANACESVKDSHNFKTLSEEVPTSTISTGNGPTRNIPTIKETTRMIPTENEPARMISTGVKSTVTLPEQNGSSYLPNNEIRQ